MGNKTIIALIIITLGLFFYSIFIKDPTIPDDGSLLVRNNQLVSAETLGREIIQALSKIENIELNTEIFSRPAYTRLIDLNQPIPEQDPGKSSPFDPIDRSFFTGIRQVDPGDVAEAIETGTVSANQGTGDAITF
jgi:hypothetical protein